MGAHSELKRDRPVPWIGTAVSTMTGSVLSRGAGTRRSADEPPDAVTLATVDVDGMAGSGRGGFAHPITHHCLGEQLARAAS